MKVAIVLLFAASFCSCTTKLYNYKISLVKPEKSAVRSYENDTMSISFDFRNNGIMFSLFNKSEEGIKINWDELSMSINGKAQRVVHKETGTYNTTTVQPPTTVPPKTILEDVIIPTDYISYYYVSGHRNIKVNDIYPKYDYGNKQKRAEVMKMKGQKIVIFFPYYIKDIYFSKTFEFIIEDITTKKR